MRSQHARKILFTGYAPVHFVCFQPLYQRLESLPEFEVFVSGGLKTKTEAGVRFDEKAMYQPFGIPDERVLPVEEIQNRDFDVLIAANTGLLAPRSVGARVQIFHGVSFRNRAVRQKNMNCDFYFVIGSYMLRKFNEAGLLKENDSRVLKIGFPKTDPLRNGEFHRGDLLRHYGFDGARPIILYAPTGERHNSLETMGEEVIKRLSQSDKYDLLIKPHDHAKNAAIDWFSRLSALENDHTKLVRHLNVVPALFLADLLITDASSVSNEYSLLNRPIVFLDVPELLKKAIKKGGILDLDTWGRRCGRVVEHGSEIVEAVSDSLNNPDRQSDIRMAMADDLFYNPGTATEKAAAWFQEKFA